MSVAINHLKKPKKPVRNVSHVAAESTAMIDAASPVDREKKIIPNVKVVGRQSGNLARTVGITVEEAQEAANQPYSYAETALMQALPLYEGVKVYNGHTEMAVDPKTGRRYETNGERPNSDLLGWLINVRYVAGDGGGIFADFCYFADNPNINLVLEAAERNPAVLAFSHEVLFSQFLVVDGAVVIQDIRAVKAVAIVNSKPGTTAGLFESLFTEPLKMKITSIRAAIEALLDTHPEKKFAAEMMGMQGMDPNAPAMEADEGTPDASPDQASKAAIVALLTQIVHNDALTVPQIMTQLKSVVQAHATVNGVPDGKGAGSASGAAGESSADGGSSAGGSSGSGTADESKVSADDKKRLDEKATKESLAKVQSDTQRLAIECTSAITAAGFEVSESLLGVTMAMTKEARDKFLAETKVKSPSHSIGGIRPRSGSNTPPPKVDPPGKKFEAAGSIADFLHSAR